MSSKILSRRDLDFLLYEWLDAESLTARARFSEHSRQTFDAVLDLCEQLATEKFATHNKKSDQHEPHFDGERVSVIPEVADALKAFSEAGLVAAGMDHELGGMQLPCLIEKAGFAWFKGANVATSACGMLSIGNASTIIKCGSQEQIERYALPILSGSWATPTTYAKPRPCSMSSMNWA